jgi:hypothetical protein
MRPLDYESHALPTELAGLIDVTFRKMLIF